MRVGEFLLVSLLSVAPLWGQESTSLPTAFPQQDSPNRKTSAELVVPAGTRLPLVLHNSVTTRNAHPGDPVFLETTFPIVLEDRVVVPAGSYVQGEIIDAKRP